MVLLRAAGEKKIKGVALDIHCNLAEKEDIQTGEYFLDPVTAGEKPLHRDTEGYYAAVDIGTTTLSIEIYDQNGKYIGGCAENNAQGKLGSDVMMRLMHVSEGRQEVLHTLIRDQIYHHIRKILTNAIRCEDVSFVDACSRENENIGLPQSPSGAENWTESGLAHLKKMSVVGNTVMCHLFLNKDTSGLRGTPFHTAYQGSCRICGKDLGWSACPDVEITVLPGIAAHVGADAASVLMAERLWQRDRVQLAVDLGTNAEILLNNR